MKILLLIAVASASALLMTGCGDSNSTNAGAQATSAANNSTPAVQPEVYAQKKVDVATLTQALQQYNAAEGHYPGKLDDLAPTYIAKVPQAPPGYKFNYDSNSGQVSLVQQ
jgi:hypothetical protein